MSARKTFFVSTFAWILVTGLAMSLVALSGSLSRPGSGGRKKIAGLSAAIQPRDHRVFLGAFNPNDPPKSMTERLVRLMPASKQILPAGRRLAAHRC